MTPARPNWRPSSDSSLLAEYNTGPALETQHRVVNLWQAVQAAGIEGIVNLHPAYRSLLVVYDPRRWTATALTAALDDAADASRIPFDPPRRMEIPFCRTPEFAPDLEDLSRQHGMPAEQAIACFVEVTYLIAFIGFAPGFPYLLGLPPELATPRLDRPRTRVPRGSIGIAGSQAGIYPAETPGGWQLIGRTPLRLFDPARPHPSLLEPGDEVRFVEIDASRFAQMDRS